MGIESNCGRYLVRVPVDHVNFFYWCMDDKHLHLQSVLVRVPTVCRVWKVVYSLLHETYVVCDKDLTVSSE